VKGKLLLGIALLIVGLSVAIMGIAGIADRNDVVRDEAASVGDENQPEREQVASVVLPVIAGVALAGGAFLVGIGMGAFRRPKIVPPDSPEASKAATTRGTTP
jgi:hypothetical protein